jgi:hypothetical protein
LAINTYRLTITVPLSVKEQMDQLKEPVNWSAVAAEAFQRKVIEVRSGRAKAMTKAKVIERLRAAGKADPKGFEAGRAFGRKWAEEKALPRYLRNLKEIDDVFDLVDEDVPGRLSARLARALTGEYLVKLDEFWHDAIGPDGDKLVDGEDFARGFIDGALEVWEEVKEDL